MAAQPPPIKTLQVDTYGKLNLTDLYYVYGVAQGKELGNWQVKIDQPVFVVGDAKSIKYSWFDDNNHSAGIKCVVLIEGRSYDSSTENGDDVGVGFARVDITQYPNKTYTIGAAIGQDKSIQDSATKEVPATGPIIRMK